MKAWLKDAATNFLGWNSVEARFHALEKRVEVLEKSDTDFDKLNGFVSVLNDQHLLTHALGLRVLEKRLDELEKPAVSETKSVRKAKKGK